MKKDLQDWFDKNQKDIEKDYFTFLRFQSISTEPNHKQDVLDCCDWLFQYLKSIGLKAEKISTSGYPVIIAEDLSAGVDAETVLFYGHYDVQPIDPIEEWKSPPFEPTVRDGLVYARGASDNKGQLFYTITAIRAMKELGNIPINIKCCFEGEEEKGSEGLSEILPKIQERIKADHVLIVDVDIPDANTPAINLGARGIVTLDVELIGSNIDLHSGHLGGISLNPLRAMTTLLAKCWDVDGRIQVPHFYDSVEEIAEEERKEMTTDLEALKEVYGIRAFAPEKPYTECESNWIRPTLEINGLAGGYFGEGFKTVIPAKAVAKISCRLVANQNPDQVAKHVAQFLQSEVEKGMEINIKIGHGGPAVRGSSTSKLAQVATSAYSEVFGKPCRKIYAGGSVPIVSDLVKAAKGDVVLIGVALNEDNIHAPNECFSLGRIEQGFLIIGTIIQKLTE